MKIKMEKPGRTLKNEAGFVLILALVTMVAMTLIGLSLVMNITTDMQLSRNERESKLAFQLAEAGINEAVARLHLTNTSASYIGEFPADAGYRTSAWNANNALGRNFGYNVGGNRNSADNLNYTVSIRYLDESNTEGFCDSNDVSPNTSANSTVPPAACVKNAPEVVMYGQDFNINATVTQIQRGILPVYRLISTGTSNTTTRTIEAFVGASSLNTNTGWGINTNGCINIAGGATNVGIVEQGAGCACDPKLPPGSCAANKTATDNMQTYLGLQLASVIDMADEKHRCQSATCSAAGDDIPSSGKIDGVVSDWGVLAGQPNTHATMIYINNADAGYVNYNEVSISGNFTGRGILIVTGNLKLTGTLTYEGLIYVFGTLTISGGGSALNVTGGVMANNTVSVNGNVTVNYDLATLQDVARQNSSSATLIWKRL